MRMGKGQEVSGGVQKSPLPCCDASTRKDQRRLLPIGFSTNRRPPCAADSTRAQRAVTGAPEFAQPPDLTLICRCLTTMSLSRTLCLLGMAFLASAEFRAASANTAEPSLRKKSFLSSNPGDVREIAGVPFCWCPAGRFKMGSPPNESERRPDEDQVEVTLSQGFWMAKYEATQGLWKKVMGKLPGPLTPQLPEGDDFPVGNVNFAEVEDFCRKLTALAHHSGSLPAEWEFRLPTEAQWEYACRAGTTTATAFGDRLSSRQANFQGKPYNGAEPGPVLGRAAKVGSYPANAWGLHDMHGNTFEWCRDWYHPKLPGGVDPDLYLATGRSRVRRGGAWTDDGWPCRSAFRLRFEPERRYDHIGFRVVAVRLPNQ
jgi:sulfatase modifying factor 1